MLRLFCTKFPCRKEQGIGCFLNHVFTLNFVLNENRHCFRNFIRNLKRSNYRVTNSQGRYNHTTYNWMWQVFHGVISVTIRKGRWSSLNIYRRDTSGSLCLVPGSDGLCDLLWVTSFPFTLNLSVSISNYVYYINSYSIYSTDNSLCTGHTCHTSVEENKSGVYTPLSWWSTTNKSGDKSFEMFYFILYWVTYLCSTTLNKLSSTSCCGFSTLYH